MMTVLVRRRFLRLGLGSVLGSLAGLAGWRPAFAAVRAVDFFAHPDSARAIGRAVLQARPDWHDPAHLAAGLLADRPQLAGIFSPRADRPAMAREVRQAIGEDFAAGSTVLVDGWLLARSEAKLCALAALG